MDTLEGILEHFVFSNEENGWSVVRVNVKGQRDPATAVGELLGVQPGESIRMQGCWVSDRKYGEQFRVESFASVKPATVVGIEKYLGSGMIKGIGPIMAARIVKNFGLETLDIIETDSVRLTEVDGIGRVRAEKICSAWQEQKEIKEVMLFLQSHGVTTTFAIKIYKQYGNEAIKIVSENPYRLAVDVFGIGFKTADKIAMNLGIDPLSLQRSEAGILYVLGSTTDEGHVYYPREQLIEKASHILEVSNELIAEAMESIVRQDLIVAESSNEINSKDTQIDSISSCDEVLRNDFIYLKSLYASEVGVARELERIKSAKPVPIEIDVDKEIKWFEDRYRIRLANRQQEAVQNAVSSKAMVITGGPGTGKTTLIKCIIKILAKKERKILLAAPTGRAAKRMSEATNLEAKTIHRLLEFSPRTMRFERNRENPLDADILVVDEVSMVDLVLFYNLLKAVPEKAQLVLVGDIDQLPSVGPGNVLKDVIKSGYVDVVRLQEIFRQAQESMIVVNAHRINTGQMPKTKRPEIKNDFIPKEEPEEVIDEIKGLVSGRITGYFGFKTDDIQVLTPMHRGLLGASNLNKELQVLLNSSHESIARGNRLFKTNDRVMQIRNNYDLEVFNGDIGKIVKIDREEREVVVNFDERMVNYDYADLDELILAYACSVHKSQGSEYPVVIMPIHTQHYMMLQRNLLYTAITRGKKLVIVVGSRRALAIAVKNNRIQERYSLLEARLKRNDCKQKQVTFESERIG
jgi:exodeoxyribonuclease V alpha subunit